MRLETPGKAYWLPAKKPGVLVPWRTGWEPGLAQSHAGSVFATDLTEAESH